MKKGYWFSLHSHKHFCWDSYVIMYAVEFFFILLQRIIGYFHVKNLNVIIFYCFIMEVAFSSFIFLLKEKIQIMALICIKWPAVLSTVTFIHCKCQQSEKTNNVRIIKMFWPCRCSETVLGIPLDLYPSTTKQQV